MGLALWEQEEMQHWLLPPWNRQHAPALLAVDPAVTLALVPLLAFTAPAGVAVVFGSTYNGEFEDVEGIDKVLSGEWR